MIGLKMMLMEERRRLEWIVDAVKKQMEDAPEGFLRISRHRKWTQYYHCDEGKRKNGKYIPVADKQLAYRLAQKTYNEKILKLSEKRLRQINRILKDYNDEEIANIFLREQEQRKNLICPIEPTWEMQLKKWLEQEYKRKEFHEDTPVILAEHGERVRSKSEKMLADCFYHNGVHYKYECPLHLKGMGIIYPDFTFLSPKMRQEIYWEHEGMMDNPNYAQSAIKKIQAYEKNGIYLGERLILTFETKNIALDTRIVEYYIRKYF